MKPHRVWEKILLLDKYFQGMIAAFPVVKGKLKPSCRIRNSGPRKPTFYTWTRYANLNRIFLKRQKGFFLLFFKKYKVFTVKEKISFFSPLL